MKRTLLRSSCFVRDLRRLIKSHPHVADSLQEILALLEEDAFKPGLRTHKLRGNLSGRWACSAGYDLRIVFKIVSYDGEEAVLLEAIGTHDEVY